MILEIQILNERPDIYINGVGLFHYLWLNIQLAYYNRILEMLDEMDETDNGEKE